MIPRLSLLLFILCGTAHAQDDDWDDDLEEQVRLVNEGELHLLAPPPDQPVHHHSNRIHITEHSLEHGWVELEQCHEHLDPVPVIQIVYHPERIRDLRILSSSGIGDARVQGANIQLQDVQPGARLCLRAQSRALRRQADGCWRLRNGPFMRQFLDGYYPMRVTLALRYPTRLRLRELDPSVRPGVQLQQAPGSLSLSVSFEGRLYTEATLCPPTE